MPPARTIHIDRDYILQSIARLSSEHLADVAAERAEWATPRHGYCLTGAVTWWWDHYEEGWVARDLCKLTGKALSPSWRIRAQQAVRELEAAGLVETLPRWIRLTEAGRARIGAEVDG
jgi:hypothetical protein